MTKWIIIRNSDDLPGRRPRNRKQFEIFPDAFDPNRPGKFGPSETYRFVPISNGVDPVYDPMTQELIPVTTEGINNEIFPGHLVGDTWVLESSISALRLPAVKRNVISQMEADMGVRTEQGYTQGNRTLDLDHGSFSILSNLYAWVSVEISLGNMTGASTVTFNDRDELPVTVTAVQLRSVISQYGSLFNSIQEEWARVKREVKQATTISETLSITWDFNI